MLEDVVDQPMGMHSWRHLDKIDKNWNLLTKLIRIVLVSSTYIELFTVFHFFSCLVEIMYQTWYHNLNSHYTIPTLSHIGKNSKTTCLEATVNSGCSTLWQWNPYIYIIYMHIYIYILFLESHFLKFESSHAGIPHSCRIVCQQSPWLLQS